VVVRSRPLGSARRGVAAFLVQRATSLYLGAFTVYFILRLALAPIGGYQDWADYFASGAVRLAWLLFVGSLLAHVWTGLRSIYMDYLPHDGWRFGVSLATAFGLIALGVWAAQILFLGAA
jgi:succinate dehydrogenase / fumarate reductase membrane anchor subunit